MARELEDAGYEVIGLSNHGGDSGSKVTQTDLLDRVAVKKAVDSIRPDVVLHLAAIAFVAHGDVDEMYRVNVVGTRNLLEALSSSSKAPELVVLASSANIYGNAEVTRIAEDTPAVPANDYAVSKLAMEFMARLWMDRLPIVITRPFNYTGVGQSEQFLIPKIVSHFRRRDSVIELGNINISRDFSDVRDVARVYRQIVAHKPQGQIFNVCSGQSHSLADILGLASDVAGYQIEVKINPAYVRTGEVHRLVGSKEKSDRYLGAIASRPMAETIKWMIEA